MNTFTTIINKVNWTSVGTHMFAFLAAYVGAHTNMHVTSLFDWDCFQAGLTAAGAAQICYRHGMSQTSGDTNSNSNSNGVPVNVEPK